MRIFTLTSSVVAIGALVACTTSTTSTSSGSSSGGSSSGSSGGSSSGSTSSSSSGGSSSGGVDAPSTTEAPVSIDKACGAFTACGGTLSGTYDYTSGCVPDVFSTIRAQCSGLDTTGIKATVKGSIYFLANSALERNVTVSISGSIKFPSSCVAGQCNVAENALKGEFSNASCTTAGSDCTCTLSRTDSNTGGTTFTVNGNRVTTADGDDYEFCVDGAKLTYQGKTSSAEDGTWELKKR